ncbi:SDR family NAD(P)-dependent oxidoreductase [Virgisporangium aurantiacum]|uniref:Gluconate 5-dehydrogenase n=1 Tax=Virgisporangium aurantiacum TaxID=175570 RepID=A0A8J4E2E3_9ACTN|nr:SDR family oxidoreductase [Virgisporangium aurantiacum]GIJ58813.1 gluconate 5-dehydrogenase [Virgisporangium aurantiacum]
MFGLSGRTAVVTGGNSGIGRVMAAALREAGAAVVLMARDRERLEATAAELGAHAVTCDLSDRADLARAADAAARLAGEPDILVNAAGINPRPHMNDLTAAVWDDVLEVNVTAPFLLGQRFGPGMADRGWGRIINVVSQQALRAYGNSGAYGVSKGGLASLTRSQAEAWSPHGVCCNAVAPGVVETPMTAAIFRDPERAAAAAARTMIGRNGRPEDFAGIAVFLAGDGSAAITGQVICVDGGFSAH